jgi:DNA repair exonuclease SbcCD nuclease subunit
MKIAVCSDLHLEFGSITLENPGDVEVLILSGDICVAADFHEEDRLGIMTTAKTERLYEFFRTCSENFPHVVYIVGNHEHYHYDFKYTIETLKSRLKVFPNIHLLDKEVFDVGDYRFIGGTLWTDMNNEDEYTMTHIRGMMNDFRCVKNSNRMATRKVPIYKKDDDGNYITETVNGQNRLIEDGFKFKEEVSTFSPVDAVEDHKKMLDYIKLVYADTPASTTTIIVGHHSPSKLSTHPRYKHEELMNGGYSSDLNEFIMDRPGIKLWTHGHTHEDFDYMIKGCRVVCNPRGYINHEPRADFFKLKVVEV